MTSVATSYFFESTVLFFHNFKICTFFVLFSGLVLFLYFYFINLAEFYQILFKSTVFVLFLENLQVNVLLIYDLQGFLDKYPTVCLRLQEIGVNF